MRSFSSGCQQNTAPEEAVDSGDSPPIAAHRPVPMHVRRSTGEAAAALGEAGDRTVAAKGSTPGATVWAAVAGAIERLSNGEEGSNGERPSDWDFERLQLYVSEVMLRIGLRWDCINVLKLDQVCVHCSPGLLAASHACDVVGVHSHSVAPCSAACWV